MKLFNTYHTRTEHLLLVKTMQLLFGTLGTFYYVTRYGLTCYFSTLYKHSDKFKIKTSTDLACFGQLAMNKIFVSLVDLHSV